MKTSARRLSLLAAFVVLLLCLGLALARSTLGLPVWALLLAALSATAALIFGAIAEVQSWQLPEPEDPPLPSEPIRPRPPQRTPEESLFQRTERKLRDAEDFSQRVNGKHRIRIETDDDDAPTPPRRPPNGTPR